jgi:hypothetical protein
VSWLIDWLQSVAFTMFGDEATTWAEVLGFITGGVCVYLVAVQNVWNWPVGIANNLLWIGPSAATRCVEEYGREHSLAKVREAGAAIGEVQWGAADFDVIAKAQTGLVRDGLPYALVTGPPQRRLRLAVRIADTLLARRGAFAAPL